MQFFLAQGFYNVCSKIIRFCHFGGEIRTSVLPFLMFQFGVSDASWCRVLRELSWSIHLLSLAWVYNNWCVLRIWWLKMREVGKPGAEAMVVFDVEEVRLWFLASLGEGSGWWSVWRISEDSGVTAMPNLTRNNEMSSGIFGLQGPSLDFIYLFLNIFRPQPVQSCPSCVLQAPCPATLSNFPSRPGLLRRLLNWLLLQDPFYCLCGPFKTELTGR